MSLTAFSAMSCKQAVKSPTKHIFSRIVKQGGEQLTESAGEKTIKVYGKEALKELPWDEIIVVLERENPLVGKGVKKLSKSFQKNLAANVQVDPALYRALLASETILDDYKQFVSGSRRLLDDADYFAWFAKSKYASRAEGADIFENLLLREDKDVLVLVDRTTEKSVARIKGNVVNVMDLSDGIRIVPDNSIIKGELLPNAVYKCKGENGLEYLYNVDEIGRISSVKASYISPEEAYANIIHRNADITLDADGTAVFKRIKEASDGQDVNILVTYKYVGDSQSPSYINIEGDVSGHNKFSQTFQNVNKSAGKLHTLADNRAIVKSVGDKLGMDAKKQEALIREMTENERLEELIYLDPEFNIQRWMNSRNHVDQYKIARQSNGQLVLNGRVYAGKPFYFDPAFNPGVAAKLKSSGKYDSYTLEQLIALDKKYPNGVRYTENGFPDFIGSGACKYQDGKPVVFNLPGGKFTGDDGQDIALAIHYMQEKYGDSFDMFGYTWHHLEEPPARLVLVDYDVHRICKHTGGNSLLN